MYIIHKIRLFQKNLVSRNNINSKRRKESHGVNMPRFSAKVHDTEKRGNVRRPPSSRTVRIWPATKQTFEGTSSRAVQPNSYIRPALYYLANV